MAAYLRKLIHSRSIQFLTVLITLLGLLTIMSEGFAVDITSIVPQWLNPIGSSGAPTCVAMNNAASPVDVRFGDDDLTNPPCPVPGNQSGFGFTPGTIGTFANGTPFILGELTHYNNQVFASSLLTGVTLDLGFTSTLPVLPHLTTQIVLDETANNLSICPYGDTPPCADRVSVTPDSVIFTEGTTNYQIEVLGLIPGTAGTCTYNQADLRLSYISDENSNNSSCLYGRVSVVSDATMEIVKSTTATVVAPGDFIDYQIDYNCASTTDSCSGVKIIDFLPDELIYVSSAGSIHTVIPTGTYSSSNNTVTFDFVDPLPAGSTGYVTIRARVRNDGTLLNGQFITNTAKSLQTNGPTSTSSVSTPVQTVSNWDVVKSGDTTAYISSEPPVTDMHYTVQMCPNNSTVNMLGAQMVDTLPANAVFVSASGGGVYDSLTNTITWSLGDLSISSCASRTVVVRFPNPPFTAGDTVVNSVVGTGTVPGFGPFTDTASVTRTLQNFVPLPSMTLNKGTTRTDYVVGALVDYFLSPANTGNVGLYNLTMTDDIPASIRVTQVGSGTTSYPMTIEYAINGSSSYTTWANVPANTGLNLNAAALGLQASDWITSIRWIINPGGSTPPGWSMNSAARITGTVTSPGFNNTIVAPPDTVVNNAHIHWEYLPGGLGTCSDVGAQCGTDNGSASIDIVPVPNPVFSKSSGGGISSAQRFIIGQQVGYFDMSVNNTTGIAVDNFVLTDDLPPQFNTTSINVGSYSAFGGGTVGLRYQASNNPGVWVTWPGSPFAQGTTVNTSALGLPANVYLSKLAFDYGTIPIGFSGSVRISGDTLAIDRNGGTVADGDNMINTGHMDWDFLGVSHTDASTTSNPIHNPTVTPSATKSVTSTAPYIPTSAVSYRLTFGAAGNSPSNVMNDPVVADLLPLNVNYVSYTYNAGSTGLAAPVFTQIPNYLGTGQTLLRWSFTGTLGRGQTVSIDLNTTLSAGTAAGTLSNTFAVTVNDMPINSGVTDTQDLDGDGQTSDKLLTASTSIPISQLIGLDSLKRVRGELDTGYSVYPQYGQTVPNGAVDYRLNIINRGNVIVNNVRVIDILPFVGDTGVQDTRPRNSAWRPVLTGPVTPQAGVTIYYSTASNPCRPEIVSTGPVGCTAPNWTLTPPATIGNVRSLRFDFAGTMAPGQSFTFNWSMRAPAFGTDQSIAWNSFAYTSTNALTGVPLRPAEPNKVGIILNTTPLTSLITLKKYTNGVDADLPTGPDIPITDPVTWTYDVTNIGQTRLANIVVTDDKEGTITCPKTVLDPNESMTCTQVSAGLAQPGQYANVGTVIGTAVDASDNPLDGDPATPAIELIQPTSTDPSHYFGYDPSLAILGDYTWIDLNFNGVQDSGEPALGGITIHLLDTSGNPVDDPTQVGTQDYITTSDANGFYSFVNLLAGDYIVQFEIPSAYSLTTANTTADTDDSDADTTTGKTGTYHLNAGESNLTADAGFIALASIGDRIWMDTNGNGIQDAAETAVPTLLEGLQVDLMDATGTTVLATTYTDAAGNYIFKDLLPGNYVLRFPIPPTGYTWTTQNASGSTATDDSDVNVATRKTVAKALLAGENDPSWDAGLVTFANIGDYVWADDNFNGKQDSGESGVSGVTVRLLNASGTQATDDNGTVIPDAITNASGAYSFTNLRPGQYEIRFTLPSGYIFTAKDAAAATDTTDSDATESGANIGRTLVTTLDPSETDNSWDAGLVKLASIGDFVWQDDNDNGQQDAGEPGVAGAIVTLLDNTGNPVTADALGNAVSPITTPASGAYSFTNLDPRVSYIVQFERPATYVFATANTGADATDSDAVPSAVLPLAIGRTGAITLTAGQNDTSIDAGLLQIASIGNYVFFDNDNNGTQNAGDTPVQNVTIRLLDSTGVQAVDERGNAIPDQTSAADGSYSFTGLRPGTYSLAFSTLPTNYTFAQLDIGADDTIDSDPNRFTGLTPTTVLAPAENDTSWDAGLVLAATLGDTVWIDSNANGQQDGGETGLSGVTVNLLDGSNVAVDNPNTPAVDTYSATTDVNGNYQFVGLPPNLTYRVQFVRPTGYLFTVANTGADATDSDGNLTGQTTVANVITSDITTLLPGVTDNTWDQGVLLPSALGDFVWRDNNDDGLQTAGEPGINGITINLLDSIGTPVDDPNTTGTQNYTSTTATVSTVAGTYAFTNLYPGSYIVEFVTPTGYKRADYYVGAGTNAATDSDMQTSGAGAGRTPVITLPYNTTDNTWDAGFVPLATLGNFVWRDNNNNGIQDAGEPGVAGATVTLLDSTGTQVTTDGMGNAISPVTTPASGAYSFTNLDPDIDYIVQFTLPTPAAGAAGYKFSPQDVNTGGGTDSNDSDANTTTGKTAVIPLTPGQTDNTWDAGMTPLSQIGDYVWNDLNGDGIQGGVGETGLNGVTVDLYLTSDLSTVIATTTTANNPVGGAAGYYQFLNLDAGAYTVKFTLLSGYIFTRQDIATGGGTDSNDSDANRFTGFTGSYTLAWGTSTQTVDAGMVQPASLGDYVWYDTNDDGLQTGETGQNGVVVRLLDASNNPVDDPNTPAVNDAYVLTTANNPVGGLPGYYLFSGLIPGSYRVQFDLASSTLPVASSNYVLARQDQGANDAVDSDPDRATGITATINLAANQNVVNTDAGILLRGANLGDRVWIDINNNGIQDAGELGLNGVTVTLLNGSGGTDIDPITAGTQTLSTTTVFDATIGNGYYQFTKLVPGTYIVQVTLPAGYQFSAQNQGADDTVDSDVAITNGQTAVITITADGNDQTWDAGVVPLASIGNYVWRDNNNDGLQDAGEPALSGVVVRLLDTLGNTVDNPNIAGVQAYTYTTAADGAYLFNNLPPSTSYVVQFDLPAHYKRSPVDANSNANDATDSDAALANGRSPATLLAPDEYNQTVDAGFVPLATLGDYVWTDTDGDGVQDAGETGRNGVTVNLYDSGNLIIPVSTTTTVNNPVGGAAGYYQFADLNAGSYVVGFGKPGGFIFTLKDINSAATTPASTDANDSDVDRFTSQTGTYVLNWGDSVQTIDAGVLQPATLGDFVFIDTNDNGVQNGGTELGVAGVTVHLLDSANNPVNDPNNATPTAYVVTTNASGNYSFTGLFPGTYKVQVDLPNASYVYARKDQGGNDTTDSDVDRTTGITGTYTLTANQTNNTADAGLMLRASLGDFVWNDLNGDGIQAGAGETGFQNVTVTLYDGVGTIADNPNIAGVQNYVIQTDVNGNYTFTNLVPGDYYVVFALPSGYVFTKQDATADTNDSDANRFTFRTINTTLISNENDMTWDAGIVQPAALGNYVWIDTNDNGIQDGGESGLSGVTVRLLDSTGTAAINDPNNATPTAYVATTNASGAYAFTGLLPGSYTVQFDLPGSTYAYARQNQGADDTVDSDADRTTGKTGSYTLVANQTDNSVDAGMMLRASIGDLVWNDVNGNGVKDAGETGIQNVTVTLYDALGTIADNPNIAGVQNYVVTTNASGIYSFTGLVPGDYYVVFTLPGGYMFTQQDAAAATDTTDSDAVRLGATQGHTINTTLISGENDTSWDAGMLQPAALGNFVWLDTDDDGVQDGGEAGVTSVTVHLLDGSGNAVNDPNQAVATPYITTTTVSGAYAFTGLFPGVYSVQFDLPGATYIFARQNINSAATTPVSTDSNDSDADRTTGKTGNYTLIANQTDNTVDAGMMTRASFGDQVWNDVNGNGVQDGGETGIQKSVTVTLYDGTGANVDDPNQAGVQNYVVQTDVNGNYTFTNLIPGDYYVVFTLPGGYIFTLQDAAAATDTTDSDVNRFTARTITTTLISGENDTSWDAGLLQPAALGNYVWVDANDNGVQDGLEAGLSNVTVHLLNNVGAAVDNPNTSAVDTYTTTTDVNGNYAFTGLFPGVYSVQFDLPNATYVFARLDQGADDTVDSDANRTTGKTANYTLVASQTDNTVDAGIMSRVSIGNFVWRDANANGIQSAGESGIGGVTVNLTDENNVTTSTTTAADGSYLFSNLVPGNYTLEFILPSAQYKFSPATQGSDVTVDSDANITTGKTPSTHLITNDLTWDAGMIPLATIGDFVWDDTDGDGVQDAGETGINGVVVNLYDATNMAAILHTTTTTNNPVGGAAGYYQFASLDAGSYVVEFVQPAGYITTKLNINSAATTPVSTDANDSDADRFTGQTGTYVLDWGDSNQTVDAGYVKPAALGNYVWTDTNDNGIQDGTESGLANITVHLLDGSGNPVNNPNNAVAAPYVATTDVNGTYSFTGLFPGSYTVQFDLPDSTYVYARQNQGADDTVDSDADRTTGKTGTYTLIANQTDNSVDAGMMVRASIGDFVWDDTNGDGLQDGTESAIPNVTVTLYNGAGTIADNPNIAGVQNYVVQTDLSGNYTFTNLVPGDYYVVFTLPSGYIFTRQDAAAATDSTDSDVDRFTARTITTALISGENDLTWDAGLLKPAKLGDFVWIDTDDTGIQGVGESGLSGITVHLLDSAGAAVNDPNNAVATPYTVTTDVNGAYAFTGLFPGDYKVQFDLPNTTAYAFARLNQGADDSLDSDADRTTGITGTYTLVADQTDNTVDAGILVRTSLGDFVWNDVNGNGVQDIGETGVQNVTVALFDHNDQPVDDPNTPAVDTYVVQTDANGKYTFVNLVPDGYYVVFTLPAGYIFTHQDAGAATDATDSDAVRLGATQGRTTTTTLISGEVDLTWDAGILQPASLGDYVWIDTNDNGIQDGTESGLNGVTVHLLDGSGNVVNDPNQAVATPYITTTNASGAYAFTGLFPGIYSVQFDLPNATYVYARQNQGSDDTVDSDANRTTGQTGNYTLIANQTDNTVDAGMMTRASFGDQVWNDVNGNGVQDGGETGIQSVTVTLYDGTGANVDDPNQAGVQNYVVQTDVNGNYTFTNLIPGDYYVVFTLPGGYIFTLQDAAAATDTTDSDVDRFTARTITTTLISGENDTSWDAGLLQPAALGNYVWVDANDNGVQDGGEAGLVGVTVHLLDNAGNPVNNPNIAVATAYVVTTNASGAYTFTGLFPGVYSIQFDLPNATYAFARLDQGADDTVDSDANRTTGKTGNYTLVADQTDNTVDAGLLSRINIGNFVWLDLNDNGIQDVGESGVSNVTVNLTDENNVTTTTTTAFDGGYVFSNLVPGNYSLEFILPSNQYEFSDPNQGSNTAKDSDANFTTGKTPVNHFTATDLTWDAGIVPLASIGDRVWIDINNNGIQDSGEADFPSVTVNLLDSTGTVIATTTTDASGNYLFDRLSPAQYAVEVILKANYQFSLPDQSGLDGADSDVSTTTGRSPLTTLIPAENDMSWDAGMVPLVSIGDHVWSDMNNNGIQDGSETGLSGITVNLLNSSGTVIATQTTDVNGDYLFSQLPPAAYRIEFVLPSHYQFSPQDAGSDDSLDSDANTSTGRTILVTLPPGTNDTSRDAGLVPLTSIGNHVWRDNDGDGIQGAGEPGVSGVTVKLLNGSGTVVSTTTTDANGDYLFDNLPPSSYAIEIVTPNNYTISPENAGADPTVDSDVNTSTGRSVTTTLIPDEDDMSWDVGLAPLASIGDLVWVDTNADGIQDAGELGLAGVTVGLLDNNTNAVVKQTSTDANGKYLFDNLKPGDYVVEVVKPAGYNFSPIDANADTADSDVNITTGKTISTTLDYGEIDLTWDAGLVLLGKIGDYVWVDANADGVQDAGETGIPNVKLTLTYPDASTASMFTDASGKYLFKDLPAGNYTVTVDATTLPSNVMGQTYDLTPPLDHSATYNLAIGETTLTLDFGYVELGTIGDTVWYDENRNGLQDPTEQGIPNVLVTLTLPDGSTLTDVTDAAGHYLFEDLYPGTYTVTVDLSTVPPELAQTFDPDNVLDSTFVVRLGAGEIFLKADFGYGAPGIPFALPTPVPTPTTVPDSGLPIVSCQRSCVDWHLYHSNQTGDWEIFRLDTNADQSIKSTNLSQGKGADDMAPTRSPDGNWIIFSSNRDGNWELYLAPSDGDATRVRRLTYNTIANDTDPVWGPNNYVVYESTRDGNWELYLLDMTTGAERRLTNNRANDINAYWSTDGKKLVFQSDRSGIWQIYQLDLATNLITRLSDGRANDVDPQYSNNSDRIAFRSYRDSNNSTLYIMNANGTGLKRISDARGDSTNQSWSTDDSLIAYQSNLDGDLDVYVYQVTTGITRKLTNNTIPDYAPTWLCNGTIVIFTSDIDGNPNIFDANAVSITAPAIDVQKDATRLTTDPADDIYPENAPVEENASREGRMPGISLGDQTDFLKPDVTVTKIDPSLDLGEVWEPINACPIGDK